MIEGAEGGRSRGCVWARGKGGMDNESVGRRIGRKEGRKKGRKEGGGMVWGVREFTEGKG